MITGAPSSGTARMLIAVDQAPRDANGERCGDPILHAAIAVDDLITKLAEMKLHDDTRDPRDEGYMDAWTTLRDWVRDAR